MPSGKQIISGVLITAFSLVVINVVRRFLPSEISNFLKG